MKWSGTRKPSMLFLGIWFTIHGVQHFVHIPFINTGPILGALALATGILILLDR